MKIWRNLLVGGLVLGMMPGTAMAAPSILGPSGYMFTPDGSVLPHGCVSVGYHHVETDRVQLGSQLINGIPFPDSENPQHSIWKANLGLFNRLEIGGAYVTNVLKFHPLLFTNNEFELRRHDEIMLNAKFSMLPLRRSSTSLVAGVIDGLGSIERTPYVYGSAEIGGKLRGVPLVGNLLPGKVRAGVGWGQGMIDGVFVNASASLSRNVELMYEWLDNDFPGNDELPFNLGFPPIELPERGREEILDKAEKGYAFPGYTGRQHNLGLRFRTAAVPGLAVDASMINFDRISAGVSYTHCFGGGHHKKGGDKDD